MAAIVTEDVRRAALRLVDAGWREDVALLSVIRAWVEAIDDARCVGVMLVHRDLDERAA